MKSTNDVLLSLADHLADLGLAQPFSTGVYAEISGLPVVGLEELPALPATALSLAVTAEIADRDPYNPDLYVRLRFRAPGRDVRKVHDLADRTYERLQTFENTADRERWPRGIDVLGCFRTVRGTASADSNGRWMRADTYRITPHIGD